MEWIDATKQLQQRMMVMFDAALKLGQAQVAVMESVAELWRHGLAQAETQQAFVRNFLPR